MRSTKLIAIVLLVMIWYGYAVEVYLSSTSTLGSSTVRAETTLQISYTSLSLNSNEALRLDFPGTRNYFNIGGTTVT